MPTCCRYLKNISTRKATRAQTTCAVLSVPWSASWRLLASAWASYRRNVQTASVDGVDLHAIDRDRYRHPARRHRTRAPEIASTELRKMITEAAARERVAEADAILKRAVAGEVTRARSVRRIRHCRRPPGRDADRAGTDRARDRRGQPATGCSGRPAALAGIEQSFWGGSEPIAQYPDRGRLLAQAAVPDPEISTPLAWPREARHERLISARSDRMVTSGTPSHDRAACTCRHADYAAAGAPWGRSALQADA